MSKKHETPLYEKYPYLVMWCGMMGSMAYYLEAELEMAEKQKCDKDVIYFTHGKPSFFRNCNNPETIHYFAVRGLVKPNMSEQEHEAIIDRYSEGYNR